MPLNVVINAATGATSAIWGDGVPAAPVVEFIGVPTSRQIPFATVFTDQTINAVTSYAWTFGDGATSTQQNPTHIYTAAGTYTVSLTCIGPGGSNTRTRSAYVTAVPATTTQTLSGSTSGVTGSPTTFSVTLNGPVPIGGGTTTITAAGATLSTSVLTWTYGGASAQSFTVTRATDGTTVVNVVNSMGLTNLGSGATYSSSAMALTADFTTRIADLNVVSWTGFQAQAEVTNFLTARDTDVHMVVPFVQADPETGSCMVIQILGARLTVAFPSSGGNGPRPLVADDEVLTWPTIYPFRFAIGHIPQASGTKRILECSARTGNTLTVTYVPVNSSEFGLNASTIGESYVVGDAIGGHAQNWKRPFSALALQDTGKAANDPAANNTLPVRSTYAGNPLYVPQTASLFGYGYCAHPSILSSRFSPWTPDFQQIPKTGGGFLGDHVTRTNLIDTSEIWVQYRMWISPTTGTPDLQGGKLVGVDADATNPQQIIFSGAGPSTNFTLPSTWPGPVAVAKFNPNPGGPGSAGLTMTTDYAAGGGSTQPGSAEPVTGKSWAATANLNTSFLPSTGQDTPDGSSAYEYRLGQWNTYWIHLVPGPAWHYAVGIRTAWNSATTSSITLIDIPDEWPAGNFDIIGFQDTAFTYSGVLHVTTRTGDVLSGITQVSGAPFNDTSGSILLSPSNVAQAGALTGQYELYVAHPGDTQKTKVFSVSNYPMIYGSAGQYANLFTESIPGYNSLSFWGYKNIELGGSSVPIKNYQNKFAEVIVSKTAPAVPSTLPTWVPAAGNLSTIVSGGSVLTNTFAAVVPPYYSAFYSSKIIDADSSPLAHPYIGTHGGLLIRGGGDATCNFNATIGLRTSGNTIQYFTLNDPTAWFGTATDSTTINNNDVSNGANFNTKCDQNWGDSLLSIDSQRRPAAPHSYTCGDIIPPYIVGGMFGTHFEAVSAAPGHGNAMPDTGNGMPGSHYLPLLSDTSSAGNVWARAGSSFNTNFGAGGPTTSAYVQSQNRSYYSHRNSGFGLRWFDHTTLTRGNNGASTNVCGDVGGNGGGVNGPMLYAKTRDVLIGFDAGGTSADRKVLLRYLNIGGGATDSVAGTFSTDIFIPPVNGDRWGCAGFCSTNGKIYIGCSVVAPGSSTFDNTAIYEVTIPATLTSPWLVTKLTLPGGQTFPWSLSYVRLNYVEKTRCFWMLGHDSNTGVSTLKVWRPPGI